MSESQIKELCRSCFITIISNNDKNPSQLYQTTINNIKLCDMFMDITSISIHQDDGLPEKICNQCETILISAYHLRLKSIETDYKLRSQLNFVANNHLVKTEECINVMPLDILVDIKLENGTTNDDNTSSNIDQFVDTAHPDTNSDYDDEDCLPLTKSFGKTNEKKRSKSSIITKQQNLYKCDNCAKEFNKRLHFKRHNCPKIDEKTMLPIWVPKQKKSKKEHKCNVCGKLFDKNIRRERHMKYHDPTGKPYECVTCKYRFKTDGSMRRHEVKHSQILANIKTIPGEKEVFSCTQCTASFNKQQSFASHMKTHKLPNNKIDGEFTCNQCPSKFVDCGEWRKHIIAHDQGKIKKKVECHICGQRFVYKSLLMDHIIRKHEQTKPFTCELCHKGFNSESMLKYHERVHTNERPYLCSECGAGFKSGSALRQHLLIHTGEKEFLCTECPSRFRNKGLLTYHLRMHTGEKPFLCATCGKGFTVNSELTKHKRIHTDERPYPCTMCDKRFRKTTTLKQHTLTHTGEKPFKCTYCERAFSQSHELRTHVRSHIGENTYQCKQCPITFRFYRELRAHEHSHYLGEKESNKKLIVNVNQDGETIGEH